MAEKLFHKEVPILCGYMISPLNSCFGDSCMVLNCGKKNVALLFENGRCESGMCLVVSGKCINSYLCSIGCGFKF
jgi:hypothetical protein